MRSSLEIDLVGQAFDELLITKQVLLLGREITSQRTRCPGSSNVSLGNHIQGDALDYELDTYLNAYPLRLGIPREVLKSKLNLSAKMFNVIIEVIISGGDFAESMIRQNMPGLTRRLLFTSPAEKLNSRLENQKSIDEVIKYYLKLIPYAPPTIKTCIADAGEDIYNALIDTCRLMPVSGEVVFKMGCLSGNGCPGAENG